MKYNFATRFDTIAPSTIRDVLLKAAGPNMINFSPGFPADDAFPTKKITEISNQILTEKPLEILQYAIGATHPPLVKQIIKFYNSQERIVSDEDDVMITSGSGQALEMAAKIFLNDGDTMVVEDPSFIGATNGFKSNGVKLIGVPMQEDGMDVIALEKTLQSKPTPKLLYIIPTFHNPTCISTSLQKRKVIYSLCLKYGVIILEDNPYSALRFKGEPIATIKSMDTHGIVVYVASLSKIISPGMRIGSVVANKEIIEKFAVLKGASDGSSTNWSQHVIARFLETTNMQEHISRIKNIYREKSMLMIEEMKKHFHPDVHFVAPKGGMFIWFTLPNYICLEDFMEASLKEHVAIVPGNSFLVDSTQVLNSVRLSFTSATPQQIKKGIKILGEITYTFCK